MLLLKQRNIFFSQQTIKIELSCMNITLWRRYFLKSRKAPTRSPVNLAQSNSGKNTEMPTHSTSKFFPEISHSNQPE